MNTRRNVAERLEEEIAIARSPPRGDQVPLLEEKSNFEEAPVNPPPLTVGDIKVSLIQLSQVVTTLAQAMTAQANREVVPYPNQQNAIMASRLRYITRMNPPTLLRVNGLSKPRRFNR